MDWDEWECTLRARKFGAKTVMARDAEFWHDYAARTIGHSPIAPIRQYYVARNSAFVARRYLPARRFWPAFALRLARDYIWLAVVRLRGGAPHPWAHMQGTWDGLRGNLGRWKHHPDVLPASR